MRYVALYLSNFPGEDKSITIIIFTYIVINLKTISNLVLKNNMVLKNLMFCFRYITTGCNTLKLILKHFGPVIKTNIQSPAGSFGVDISREERYRKSVKCHAFLVDIRSFLLKKQSTPGTLGSTFKEVTTLMENTLD